MKFVTTDAALAHRLAGLGHQLQRLAPGLLRRPLFVLSGPDVLGAVRQLRQAGPVPASPRKEALP